jgi:hypothetical protein
MNAHVDLDWRKAGDIGLYTVPMAARILRDDGTRIRSLQAIVGKMGRIAYAAL